MTRPHVWIVGFPRCGSASLCQALGMLGWNPIHNPRNWDQLEGHDAAGDVMITAHWRELSRMFPQSLLILNSRTFDDWAVSLQRIPGFWRSGLLYDRYYREAVYRGATPDTPDRLRDVWEAHHEAVRQEVPRNRLLKLPLPFAWEPLCEFLDVPVPSVSFPWLNRQSHRDARPRTPDAEGDRLVEEYAIS